MSDNLREFSLELDRAATEIPAELVTTVHKKLHLEALGRIVRRTPVDTGRARGNWQSTVGSPAGGEREVAPLEPLKEKDIPASTVVALFDGALRDVRGMEPFSVSYLTNNLNYISVLEEGGFVPPDPGPSSDPRKDRKGRVLVRGGYSVQAPQGMVALTFAELEESIGATDE